MSVMEQKDPPRRTRHKFTDELKRDAVALVIDEDRTVADVAGSLGIGEGTLGNWVCQARIDRGERAGVSMAEREELVNCAGRTPSCGWNEICSNERRRSG